MTSPTVTEVLAEHRYFAGIKYDWCGCRERFQSRADHDAHVEAMLHAAGLLAEDGETVTEWGVRVADDDPDYLSPTDHKAINGWRSQAAYVIARSPATRSLVSRQRTTFPGREISWTEVTTDG